MKPMMFRRRNYLINKDFQLRYVAKVLFGIAVMALIVALTIYYTTWSRIMDAFYYLPAIASQFASLFTSVNHALILILIVFIFIAAIFSVIISHRIAGPLFRFEKSLETIGNGDLSIQVVLRKNDEFHYLAENFNLMINNLGERVKKEQQAVIEINQLLQQAKQTGKKSGLDQATVEKLTDLVAQLKEDQQEHFKVSN